MRHFWPGFNDWLNELPDTRFQPFVVYERRFLMWVGLMLFCCKLGSRRQIDYQLRDPESFVLENLNGLAGASQQSLPVNKTLDHFLSHVGSEAIGQLRDRCVRTLIRGKVLDACRLGGHFVLAFDGTGFLSFHRRHCPSCLHQSGDTGDCFLHQVLEAKMVDPRGLAISVGTEFIENDEREGGDAAGPGRQSTKQDCELKAFLRLAPRIKSAFPQTPFCVAGDSLLACGPAMEACRKLNWSFVLTFKPGRTPALWQEFQALLGLNPANRLLTTAPDGTRCLYRWVNDLEHLDSAGRIHRLGALLCQQTDPDGTSHTFSWITDKNIHQGNVRDIATRGGRCRFKIENQGFNTQKNGGLNLEHAYSTGEDTLKAFYLLLQIAHLFLQMLEMGSLLRRLAERHGGSPAKVFGSSRNIARRLLDCLRYFRIGAEFLGPCPRMQIRLDSS